MAEGRGSEGEWGRRAWLGSGVAVEGLCRIPKSVIG